MRKGIQGEIDLEAAKEIAEQIEIDLYEMCFISDEKHIKAARFASSKIADRILAYGDEIRDTCKAAYIAGITEKIGEIEP